MEEPKCLICVFLDSRPIRRKMWFPKIHVTFEEYILEATRLTYILKDRKRVEYDLAVLLSLIIRDGLLSKKYIPYYLHMRHGNVHHGTAKPPSLQTICMHKIKRFPILNLHSLHRWLPFRLIVILIYLRLKDEFKSV